MSAYIEKLKTQKAQAAIKLSSIQSKINKEERKRNTRKKILAGAYLLEKYKENENELVNLLDGFLKRDADRAVYGLKPLLKSDDKFESANSEFVFISVDFEEKEIQTQIKDAGGKWNSDKKFWKLLKAKALELNFEDRIIKEDV